jgi:rhodanese-related sulfurtransferase
MKATVIQAMILTFVGVFLGLASNLVSPKRIAWVTPPKKQVSADEYLPLAKAHEWWSGGAAVFLDARAPEDYQAGHIGNAVNLPALAYEQHFPAVAPLLSAEAPIVVYCDGIECELSHRVAGTLRQQGYTNLHILLNGWTVWRDAGHPTQTGGGGG